MSYSHGDQLRGGSLALISAICLSATFIASKYVLQHLSVLAFAPLWFGAATIWSLLILSLTRNLSGMTLLSSHMKPLFWVGVTSCVGTYVFFLAIEIGDATLVSFLSRSETIFSVLLGVFLMHERLSVRQWAGFVLAVTGAGVMTYRGGDVIIQVVVLVLVANFFLALTSYIAKKTISNVPATIIALYRTMFMTVVFFMSGLLTNELTIPAWPIMQWILVGALLGPSLSFILYYRSLKYIDLGHSAVIRSIQPLFVALGSFLLLNTIISVQQATGGIIIILGIMLLVWRKKNDRPV